MDHPVPERRDADNEGGSDGEETTVSGLRRRPSSSLRQGVGELSGRVDLKGFADLPAGRVERVGVQSPAAAQITNAPRSRWTATVRDETSSAKSIVGTAGPG